MKRIAVLNPEVRSQKSEVRCLISVLCLLSSVLCLLSSECNAAAEESVKSNVMSFAKKKAVAEINEVAPSVPSAPSVPVAQKAPAVFVEAVETKKPIAISNVADRSRVIATPASAPAPVPAAPAVSVSEAQTKFQAIKTQEQWVAKLTKQLEGEKNQLIEMRTGLSQAFSLDPKKLEAGKYEFDSKAGKIVEKK